MAAPYSDLQGKAEAALAAVIQTALTLAGDTTPIYAGLGTVAEMAVPRVIASADAGPENYEGTGNFWLGFTAEIISEQDPDNDETAAAQLVAHRLIVARVCDAIKTATLAADLTAAVDDFTCQTVQEFSMPNQTAQDRQISTSMSFSGLCCPSDLAA